MEKIVKILGNIWTATAVLQTMIGLKSSITDSPLIPNSNPIQTQDTVTTQDKIQMPNIPVETVINPTESKIVGTTLAELWTYFFYETNFGITLRFLPVIGIITIFVFFLLRVLKITNSWLCKISGMPSMAFLQSLPPPPVYNHKTNFRIWIKQFNLFANSTNLKNQNLKA